MSTLAHQLLPFIFIKIQPNIIFQQLRLMQVFGGRQIESIELYQLGREKLNK